MKYFKTKLLSVGILLTLLSGLIFGSTVVLNARADPISWNPIYLPIIMTNYKTPPPVTISHYISWGQSDLTYQKFYDMGKTLGQSVTPGFWGYVILHFGEPWMEGST